MRRLIASLIFLLMTACTSTDPATQASESSGMVQLEGVDFMGGDYKHQKTPSGAAECSKVCANDPQCIGFTFAKDTHPVAKKRGSCYLKREGFRYQRSPHYASGVRR